MLGGWRSRRGTGLAGRRRRTSSRFVRAGCLLGGGLGGLGSGLVTGPALRGAEPAAPVSDAPRRRSRSLNRTRFAPSRIISPSRNVHFGVRW